MNSSLNAASDAFLRKVRQGIAPLPLPEQEDIIAELRSHLFARLDQGHPDPLAGFETPEKLAADFVAEYGLRGALSRGTPYAMSKALFVAAQDSILALLVLLPLLLLQLGAFCCLLTAVLKPFMPDRVGLWIGPGTFFVGTLEGHPGVHEVLGWWGMPILATVGVLLFWVANRAMLALIRSRLRAHSINPSHH